MVQEMSHSRSGRLRGQLGHALHVMNSRESKERGAHLTYKQETT